MCHMIDTNLIFCKSLIRLYHNFNMDPDVVVHVAYNEIIEYAPWAFIGANKTFHARAVDFIAHRMHFGEFTWEFWHAARTIWTFTRVDTTDIDKAKIVRLVTINNFVRRATGDIKHAGNYNYETKRRLEYFHPLAIYIINTLARTGECLLASVPVAFYFIGTQLSIATSGLNASKIVNARYNRTVFDVKCNCYSKFIENYIMEDMMIPSSRVKRAISCAMERYYDRYSVNAHARMDEMIDDDNELNRYIIGSELHRVFGINQAISYDYRNSTRKIPHKFTTGLVAYILNIKLRYIEPLVKI
ncbi:hypothetical protein F-LCD7_0021 [Faustovirus]|nr:hypothetical protein F-LCD7_0021 [Faustovirus]